MSFLFQCPNGHVLEGDPGHAGQQCQCPTCGILFIIPAPAASLGDAASAAPPGPSAPPSWAPPFHAPGHTGPGFTPPTAPAEPAPAPAPGPAPAPFSTQPEEEKLYHIPCPNGHELETPAGMLDQDVLCPNCGVQFRLREKDSVEYQRKQREERERRDRKLAKSWLNWAIVVVVVVLLGLFFLILSGTRD